MLKYEEFLEYVQKNIKDYLPEEYAAAQIDIKKVIKNNDVELDALTILKPDSIIAPTIYLNGMYKEMEQNEKSLDSTLLDIAELRVRNDVVSFDVSQLTNIGAQKEHIMMRLVNYESNSLKLANEPYTKIGDLAAIYRVDIPTYGNNKADQASMVITNEVQERYNISTEQLHALALKNMQREYPATLTPMSQIITKMMTGEVTEEKNLLNDITDRLDESEIYVLSNKSKMNGASALLYPGLLDRIGKLSNGNIYIIPSSVHETMVMKASDMIDPTYIDQMVDDVNQSEVSKEEQLSNHAYEYDVKEHALFTIADHKLLYKFDMAQNTECNLDKMIKSQYKNNEIEIDPEIEM